MGHPFFVASHLEAELVNDASDYELPLSDDLLTAYNGEPLAELAGSPRSRLRSYLFAAVGIAGFCYLAPALYEAERLNEEARLQAVAARQQEAINDHVRWTLHVRSMNQQQSGGQMASSGLPPVTVRRVDQDRGNQ